MARRLAPYDDFIVGVLPLPVGAGRYAQLRDCLIKPTEHLLRRVAVIDLDIEVDAAHAGAATRYLAVVAERFFNGFLNIIALEIVGRGPVEEE